MLVFFYSLSFVELMYSKIYKVCGKVHRYYGNSDIQRVKLKPNFLTTPELSTQTYLSE